MHAQTVLTQVVLGSQIHFSESVRSDSSCSANESERKDDPSESLCCILLLLLKYLAKWLYKLGCFQF